MPQADQTQDVCQVHALNILKALFGDATLVLSLMPRYTEVLLIIFDGFESPSWAIRNAATQLFGNRLLRYNQSFLPAEFIFVFLVTSQPTISFVIV